MTVTSEFSSSVWYTLVEILFINVAIQLLHSVLSSILDALKVGVDEKI